MLNTDDELFERTLSKDEQPPGYVTKNRLFAKTLADDRTAATEYAVLDLLRPDRVAPEPRFISGTLIAMDVVEGMRVFELLTLLHAMRDRIPPTAVPGFLDRLCERLRLVQGRLTEGAYRWPADTYPFDTKILALIGLLSRLLGVAEPDTGEWEQWHRLSGLWEEYVDTPFRDATAKNMILADPRLGIPHSDERAATLESLLRDDPAYLLHAPLVDVDFSSCVYMSTWEDDWISLLMHEASARWVPRPKALLLRDPDPLRWNLTVLVRYLRFGGRKMAYALMHPAAAAVRFALDDAGYYLRRLPGLLDTGFHREFGLVVRRIETLGAAFDALEIPVGHADPWGGRRVWRESPLELT